MVLDQTEAHINVSEFKRFLRSQMQIKYSDATHDQSLFTIGHVHLLEEAGQNLIDLIEDNPHLEKPFRDTLCYLLNCSDEYIAAIRHTSGIPFRGSVADFRRYLLLLWERVFADWRVKDFDPDTYSERPVQPY